MDNKIPSKTVNSAVNVIKRTIEDSSINAESTPMAKKVKTKIQPKVPAAAKEKNKGVKKQLTPKQRIDRLKRKVASKRTTQNDESVYVSVSPVIDSTGKTIMPVTAPGETQETYDHYFVDESGRLVLDDTIDMAMNENGIISTPQISSQNSVEFQLESTIETVNRQDTSESTDIRHLLTTLNGKFDDLNGQIIGLKRQVARLEAKSTMCRNPNEAISIHENDDTFVDFDSALAAEGLPAKSLELVFALENRLKNTAFNTSSYRQKLVSQPYTHTYVYKCHFHLSKTKCTTLTGTVTVDDKWV